MWKASIPFNDQKNSHGNRQSVDILMGFWHSTLNYGTLAYKYLKLKKNYEIEAESHSEMPPPHPSPLNRSQNSHGKVASLYQEGKRHYYHHKWGIWGPQKSVQTNHVKLALIFLVMSSPLTISSPKLFLCQLFTNVLLLYLKHVLLLFLKQLCWLLWVFILSWRLSGRCTNLIKCVWLSPVILCLYQFNSLTQSGP